MVQEFTLFPWMAFSNTRGLFFTAVFRLVQGEDSERLLKGVVAERVCNMSGGGGVLTREAYKGFP